MKFFTNPSPLLIIFFVNFFFLSTCTIKEIPVNTDSFVCFKIVTKNLDPAYSEFQKGDVVCQREDKDYDQDGIVNKYDGLESSQAGDHNEFLDKEEDCEEDCTYLIHNVGQIQGLWTYKGEDGKDEADKTNWLDKKYRIAQDIEAKELTIEHDDPDFPTFTGEIDGQRHTISNLTINSNLKYVALFPKVSGNAKFKNIILKNIKITGGDKTTSLGGLVGYAEGNNLMFENITIEAMQITGGAKTKILGGLAGYAKRDNLMFENITIEAMQITGGAKTKILGGLVGYAEGNNLMFENITINVSKEDFNPFYNQCTGTIIGFLKGDEMDAGTIKMDNSDTKVEGIEIIGHSDDSTYDDRTTCPSTADTIKCHLSHDKDRPYMKNPYTDETCTVNTADDASASVASFIKVDDECYKIIGKSSEGGIEIPASEQMNIKESIIDNDYKVCTSNVTDMSALSEKFDADKESFNEDISNWDVSNVTNMDSMFKDAKAFNQDISTWDVSNVTKMNDMFSNANDFNQDISSWDVSNVTIMLRMFFIDNGDVSAFNQDISGWDVSNVTSMSNMFDGATMFNQDLSDWNVCNVTNHTDFSDSSALSMVNMPDFGDPRMQCPSP